MMGRLEQKNNILLQIKNFDAGVIDLVKSLLHMKIEEARDSMEKENERHEDHMIKGAIRAYRSLLKDFEREIKLKENKKS